MWHHLLCHQGVLRTGSRSAHLLVGIVEFVGTVADALTVALVDAVPAVALVLAVVFAVVLVLADLLAVVLAVAGVGVGVAAVVAFAADVAAVFQEHVAAAIHFHADYHNHHVAVVVDVHVLVVVAGADAVVHKVDDGLGLVCHWCMYFGSTYFLFDVASVDAGNEAETDLVVAVA